MNGFNFQQLKKLGKSNFFTYNLLNEIKLFLGNAIDRVEVAGSSPVGIIIKKPELKCGVRVLCFFTVCFCGERCVKILNLAGIVRHFGMLHQKQKEGVPIWDTFCFILVRQS